MRPRLYFVDILETTTFCQLLAPTGACYIFTFSCPYRAWTQFDIRAEYQMVWLGEPFALCTLNKFVKGVWAY